jgi:DNA ligase-1
MSFKPMLAHSKSPDPATLRYPLLVQPKLDGIRASVVDGKLVSRTLKAIPNASIRAVLEQPLYEGLDGELIVGEPNADDCYRRTSSFVMAEAKTGEPWAFYVFDKWDEAGAFGERYEAAVTCVNGSTWGDDPVFMVPTFAADSATELERMEAEILAQGYEGAILRDPHGAYKFGRSGKTGPLLKLKRYIDFEAVVIGVYEEQHNGNVAMTNALGRTERSTAKSGKTGKGTLGGLVLRAINGPAEGVEFRCGTGFDAEQRAALWAQAQGGWSPEGEVDPSLPYRDALNGTVAKIKSFPIGVKDKPRHPVWLGWRDMEVDG